MVDMPLPFWFQILVTLNLYWVYILPAVLIGGVFGFLRLFTMPLLTRNPHELVIILGANKAKIYKVVSRHLPFFLTKRGAYWFSEPKALGHNLIHVYFEGINQPVYELKRNPDKESHVMSHRDNIVSIKSHTVIIPPGVSSFTRNWVLVIKSEKVGAPVKVGEKMEQAENITIKLVPAKVVGLGKQPYKIGFFKHIGVYRLTEATAEGANTSASKELQSVTVQTIIEKVGGTAKGMNFSSSFSFRLIRNVRRIERNWQLMLTGGFDPRIILALIIMLGMIAMAYFLFLSPDAPFSAKLPPPPPGLNVPGYEG